MSTNFYATIIPAKEQIAKMQSVLAKRQIDSLRTMLNNYSVTYHIGKRSCGWQFLFCPHIKSREGFWNTGEIVSPWEDTLESIKKFLSREDVVIEDEYGKKYTSDEFWKEIEYCLYNDPKDYINAKQYYSENNEFRIGNDNYEYTTDEGLRFSTCEDFS